MMTVRDCNLFADDVVKTFQMTPDANMLEPETEKTGDECETKQYYMAGAGCTKAV